MSGDRVSKFCIARKEAESEAYKLADEREVRNLVSQTPWLPPAWQLLRLVYRGRQRLHGMTVSGSASSKGVGTVSPDGAGGTAFCGVLRHEQLYMCNAPMQWKAWDWTRDASISCLQGFQCPNNMSSFLKGSQQVARSHFPSYIKGPCKSRQGPAPACCHPSCQSHSGFDRRRLHR